MAPLPQFADAALQRLRGPESGPLAERLAEALNAMAGTSVAVSDFDAARLPPYLLMRFEVIDHLRSEGVITQVVEQAGNKALTGFFKTLTQPRQPIDLLKGDLIHTASLGSQHLSRPGEGVVKLTELGLINSCIGRGLRCCC